MLRIVQNLSYLKDLSFRYLLLRDQELRDESVVVKRSLGTPKDVNRRIIRPWHVLPNVWKVRIELRSFDWLFMLFGLSKRVAPKLIMETGYNGNMNRYIEYMFKRISKIHDLVVAGKVARDKLDHAIWILMRSTSYQVAAYNHVMTNWYKNRSLNMVRRELKILNKLCMKKSTKLDYHRTYIPKGQTWRPLGVPSVPWRVYLHMINNIIVHIRMKSESEVQHGYIPGRGILTAWKRLFKILKYSYVFEIDFEKFFDNVHLWQIQRQIAAMGFSKRFCSFITEINRFPVVVKKAWLNESNALAKWWALYHEKPRFSERSRLAKLECWHQIMADVVNRVWSDYTKSNEWLLSSPGSRGERVWDGSWFGVPQGAPTSCALATLVLRDIEKKLTEDGIEMVAYADDLVIASNKPFNPADYLERPDLGLYVNWDKSDWVKWCGRWRGYFLEGSSEKGIKFLGIRYIPSIAGALIDLYKHDQNYKMVLEGLRSTKKKWSQMWFPTLMASTRKGATLKLNSEISLLAYLAKSRDIVNEYIKTKGDTISVYDWIKKSQEKWLLLQDRAKSIGSSPIYGWIVNRLQSNSWESKELTSKKLEWTKSSWISLRWTHYKQEWLSSGYYFEKLNILVASTHANKDIADWLKETKLLSR